MKEITIIELLNKISRGKELPKRIKYENSIYEYQPDIQDYEKITNSYNNSLLAEIFQNECGIDALNSKAEILTSNEQEEIKDIIEILDLCKEDIENNNENISATLDFKDLKSLKSLYDLYLLYKRVYKEDE